VDHEAATTVRVVRRAIGAARVRQRRDAPLSRTPVPIESDPSRSVGAWLQRACASTWPVHRGACSSAPGSGPCTSTAQPLVSIARGDQVRGATRSVCRERSSLRHHSSTTSSTQHEESLGKLSRWGSCTVDGTILLNPRLVTAPTHCVDYVILHELCHLKHHDHTKAFYRLLGTVCPGWQRSKERLERNH
jgi:hypothetical protein